MEGCFRSRGPRICIDLDPVSAYDLLTFRELISLVSMPVLLPEALTNDVFNEYMCHIEISVEPF